MPIDRHTPGDEFDRNDEARVETCADVGTDTGIGAPGAVMGAFRLFG